MDLNDKIKKCQTLRELDELRIEIMRAAENGGKNTVRVISQNSEVEI